jgi:hypothetical protein
MALYGHFSGIPGTDFFSDDIPLLITSLATLCLLGKYTVSLHASAWYTELLCVC